MKHAPRLGSAVLAEFSCLGRVFLSLHLGFSSLSVYACRSAVLYLFIELAECSINSEINRDACKLAQIPELRKKDMKNRKSHKTQSLDILDHIHGMIV
jgi:hypothetical protein